jgi:hypothetical protein
MDRGRAKVWVDWFGIRKIMLKKFEGFSETVSGGRG